MLKEFEVNLVKNWCAEITIRSSNSITISPPSYHLCLLSFVFCHPYHVQTFEEACLKKYETARGITIVIIGLVNGHGVMKSSSHHSKVILQIAKWHKQQTRVDIWSWHGS